MVSIGVHAHDVPNYARCLLVILILSLKGDRALMALSTSGEMNEYQALSVDENCMAFVPKLTYVEVRQPCNPCNVV